MTATELDDVRGRIEQEGFGYCFIGYSNWEEIQCPEFQKFRQAYVKAHNDLAKFLNVEDLG